MQNKLNEILELCIEKSNRDSYLFYYFSFCAMYEELVIKKYDKDMEETEVFDLDFIDKALKYMQNE